jgi:hypothetical protein
MISTACHYVIFLANARKITSAFASSASLVVIASTKSPFYRDAIVIGQKG